MTKIEKVRAAAILGIPLVLTGLGVVYAPGLDAKLLTGWGFILGVFEGAVAASYARSRKA